MVTHLKQASDSAAKRYIVYIDGRHVGYVSKHKENNYWCAFVVAPFAGWERRARCISSRDHLRRDSVLEIEIYFTVWLALKESECTLRLMEKSIEATRAKFAKGARSVTDRIEDLKHL